MGPGVVELKNYVEDPLVALTFRVEFSATLPVKPARNIQLIVAWEIKLPELNREGQIPDQPIKLQCKLGNQFSIQNDMVWGVQGMDPTG